MGNEEGSEQTNVVVPPSAPGSFEGELLAKTYDIGATVSAFITQLQQSRLLDQRWVSIAKTHFQEGLSATRRAIWKHDRY